MDRLSATLLREAETFEERIEAVDICIARGVPLSEIEMQLDYIDSLMQQIQ